MLEQLNRTIIISCQAYKDEPLYGGDIMTKMALAAKQGGACAVRANGVADIKSIKKSLDLIVIGINKANPDECEVFITPTVESALAVIDAGADIVAMDCTNRKNINGEYGWDLIGQVKALRNVLVMAETSTLDEAVAAYGKGADIIATTLAGYTAESRPSGGLPDFELIAEIHSALPDAFINAEGRFETPEQVKEAFRLGAGCVTIGSAVTRPQHIVEKYFEEMKEWN